MHWDSRGRMTGWLCALVGLHTVLGVWACAAGVTGGVRADEHSVVWLGQEQGLPGGTATMMVQARDGYLWFGTFEGVARFDGVSFKVFDTSNTPELPSNGIALAFCERSGRLWFSTYSGMVSLTDGRWHRHGAAEGWTADSARTFSEGPDGTLYVTTFDGKVLRHKDGRFEELPPVPDVTQGGLGHCDAAGRFWVVKDPFVGFWDGVAWTRVDVSLGDGGLLAGDPERDSGLGAGSARDGSLWMIRHRLLVKVDVSGVVRRVLLDQPVQTFWRLHEDRRGDLWISTLGHGVHRIRVPSQDGASGSAMGQVTHIGSAGGRDFSGVSFVAEDDEGNVWMGTSSEGVARWQPKLFEVMGKDQGMPHGNAHSLSVGLDGRLWVACYGGGIFHCDNPTSGQPRFHGMDRYLTAEAESVLADRSGRVWATRLYHGGPVIRLEGRSPETAYTRSVERHARWGLHEDAAGVLWVAGPGELLSHQEGRWTHHAPKDVRVVAEDPRSHALWTGGREGVHRRQDGGFVEVRDATGNRFPPVTSLHPAPEGGMWIGTEGKGLILRRADGTAGRVGTAQGLPMKNITIVHSDGAGRLWLGGERGLAYVVESEAVAVASGGGTAVHARLFGPEDGLPVNCNALYARTPSVARTADGYLWFPTSRGVVRVDPGAIPRDSRPPRVLAGTVTHVDAAGGSHEASWTFGGRQAFGPGTRSIQFNFSALSYAAPQRVLCRVRLHREGTVVAERLGPERSVTWDLLPPGDYSLSVSAANETGVWSQELEPLSFSVLPHYWQTTGFRWGLVLASFAVVLLVTSNRIRGVQMASRLALAERDRIAAMDSARHAEDLRRTEGLRRQAEAEALWRRRREAVVRDVHDGIGGLASNLKMTVNLALRTRDENLRTTLLQGMDSLVGETLVEVRGLMSNLESEMGTCGDVADEFRRHGNLMLEPHQIDLAVRTHLPETILPKDPRFFPSLFRIYKEAIANIVKHARCSRVEVSVEARPDSLRVVVADDGVGLPSRHAPGRGVANMRRRAADLGGHVTLVNDHGLRVEIVVPWHGTDSGAACLQANPSPP